MPILPNNDLDYIDEESEDITSEDMTDGSSVTENNATYNDPFDYNGPADIGVPDALPVDPVVPESSEDRYYVTYYNRGDLTDYEPAYLQELAEAGCKFYAIYDDETEVEIQWTEIEDLDPLETEIDISASIAAATNQHFWDDTNGVHVAEVAKEDWQVALEANFADLSSSKNYYNILMNSLGLLLRRANFNLTSINRASISFYDGLGNETTNIMASFGRNSAQIGRSNDKHVVIDNSGLTAYNSDGTLAPLTGTFDGANINNSSITNAKIVDGTIQGTKIASATIDNSNIKNGTIEGAKIASATIDNSNIKNGTITGAKIADGTIENTDIKNGTITGTKIAASTIENSNIKDGTIQGSKIVGSTLTGIPYAGISDADIEVARVANAEIAKAEVNYAHITNGVIDNAKIDHADVNGLSANYATITNLNAANGRISDLESTRVRTTDLEANYITADTIEANYTKTDLSNTDVAWIQNGTIKDGAISNAMIGSLSASKLTAGTINGNTITVTNLNADNITAGTLNGQRIGEGSLSLSKLEEDVYTESEVDNIVSNLQTQIDGAIETWTGTAVPTLNNSPASGWTTNAVKDTHVGDVYFVVNSNSQQNGYNYRFAKSGSTYSWQLIKDSDVTNALQRLSTAEGKITTFDSDISQLKTDTGTLTTKTTSLETRMSNAESDILDKVDTTTFNEVSDTVDSHSQSITQMSTTLSNKADSSTVTAVINRVSKTEQDISGINTTIGTMQTTLASKADGSTVETMSTKLNTVSDTVDGHTQSISSINSTLSTKADSSTVSTLSTKVNTIEDTVDGHTQSLQSVTSTQTSIQQNAVKSTVQLWFTKDNTTAPNKPTAHVTTNNAATGNAWNLAVPTYNASYPNYYYCYEYQYLDGSYGWSAVTRDIATGEMQATARQAQSDIDNLEIGGRNLLKETSSDWTEVSLSTSQYFLEVHTDYILEIGQTYTFSIVIEKVSSDTVPIHLHVGNGNRGAYSHDIIAWRKNNTPFGEVVSITHTITEADLARGTTDTTIAPYFSFRLRNEKKATTIQYRNVKLEKGTKATDWTPAPEDVDADISTAQTSANNAQATADKNVKESTQLWFTKANGSAPSKPTSAVTSTSTSGNAWTTKVPTYSASYPHYFYCMQYKLADGTYTWSDVVYDQATTEAQSVARTTSTNLSTLQQDYATFKQTTQNFESTIGTTYATKTEVSAVDDKIDNLKIGGRNLLPSSAISSKNIEGSTKEFQLSPAQLRSNFGSGVGKYIWNSFEENTQYTFTVTAFQNDPSAGTVGSNGPIFYFRYSDNTNTSMAFSHNGTCDPVQKSMTSTAGKTVVLLDASYGNSPCVWTYRNLKLEKGNRATDWTPAPEDVDADISSIETRLSTAETSITQNNQQIALKANSSDVYTKTQTDGLMSTEVSNRNSAIEQSAAAINLSVSQNYTTKTEFNTLEIGGRNLLLWTGDPRIHVGSNAHTDENHAWAVQSGGNGVGSIAEIDDSPVYGLPYAFRISGNTTGNRDWQQRVEDFSTLGIDGEWIFSAYVRGIDGNATYTVRVWSGEQNFGKTGTVGTDWTKLEIPVKLSGNIGSASGSAAPNMLIGLTGAGSIEYIAPKLERGNRATDWTPAPEDGDATFKQVLMQPNLSPFFASHNTDGTYPIGNADGYWQPTADKQYNRSFFTAMEDGWVHINIASNNSAMKEFVPPRINSLVSGDKVTFLLEWRDVQADPKANFYTRNYPNNVQLSANYYFGPKITAGSGEHYWTMTVNSTADGSQAWNGLVNLTFPTNGGAFVGDIRISAYKGKYNSPYKPYNGSLLYTTNAVFEAAKSEIKATTDGITSTVEKISSAKYLTSAVSAGAPLSSIRGFASTTTTFQVTDTKDARVGDTIYLKYKDSTRNCYVYIKGVVTVVNSTTSITLDTRGYEDVLPVDTIKSTINQSSDSVKIQAKHVEIDGAAIFSNSAFKAAADAAYDAKGSASAVQDNLDNLEIGGRNLLYDTSDWSKWSKTPKATADGEVLTCANTDTSAFQRANGWFVFDKADLIDREIVVSFDAKKTDSTELSTLVFQLFTTSAAPKSVVSGNIPEGTRFFTALSSTPAKATIENARSINASTWTRVCVKFVPSEVLDTSYTDMAYLAVYIGIKNVVGSAQFRHIKAEFGNRATDWTPAPEDVDANISLAIEQAKAPIDSKTYTGIIGTANSFAGANFFFGKLYPDNYNKGWQAKLRIECEAPDTYQQSLDITFGGYGSTFSSYDSVTSLSSARAFYYFELFRATSTGINANAGHMLGISLQSATNPTSSSYARTIRVDILEVTNCTIELNNTAVAYTSMAGYSVENYGDGTTNLTQMNVATAGQNATNNTNTNDTARYVQFYNTIVAGEALVKESLIGGHEDGKFYQISGANDYFMLSQPLLWTTIALNANATNYANIYTQCYDRNLATYYTAFANTLANKIVYLVGTIDGNKFTIYGSASNQYLTVTEPTTSDGRFYIPLGRLGNQSNGKNYFNFQVSYPVALYAYLDGKFRQVTPTEVVGEQYIYHSVTSGTNSMAKYETWVEPPTSVTASTQNSWTTKRPEYSSSYPVLFVAKQTKRLDGTVTCTTPVKDDTITVIDGGHITTGTIDADRISTTVVNAINANVSDTINADKINVSAISIGSLNGASDYATKTDAQGYANAKDDAIAAAAKRTDVAVAVTAIDYNLGTATLQATLYIDGTATTSNVTYKWLKDGSVISGQTARTLSVTAAMGLSHVYSCTVTYS